MTTNLRHNCDDDGCYLETLWDWTPLNGCFGETKIRMGDVDGIVERNDQFLLVDGKRVKDNGDTSIKPGQLSMFKAFAKMGGTVIVFHGEPPTTVRKVRAWKPGGELAISEAMDLDGMKELISRWFQWADSKKSPL